MPLQRRRRLHVRLTRLHSERRATFEVSVTGARVAVIKLTQTGRRAVPGASSSTVARIAAAHRAQRRTGVTRLACACRTSATGADAAVCAHG